MRRLISLILERRAPSVWFYLLSLPASLNGQSPATEDIFLRHFIPIVSRSKDTSRKR